MSVERTYLIEPRDPVIFRDGKPFSPGLSSRSTGWPAPSAVIGAIRTRLGIDTNFPEQVQARLKRIRHIGPFLATAVDNKWKLAFPAPADAVAFDSDGDKIELCALRPGPLNAGEGTDLGSSLELLFGARDQKPSVRAPEFWTADFTLRWLSGEQMSAVGPEEIGFAGLPRQRRLHVAIDSESRTARDQMLFATEGLEFSPSLENGEVQRAICSRIIVPDDGWAKPERAAPLGGERRLAYWTEADVDWPKEPTWNGGSHLRMQLVTPGAFSEGWKPGWIGPDGTGSPPRTTGLKVRLVGAAVARALPVSGWDYVTAAPKATRFLAPAGSTYFLEILDGLPAGLWLSSICDQEQDRLDGFGLVIYGGW